ncbi:CAP domain-containing protein [Thermomicrobiaceae bacterium CFH 74404]|uniref:CAP domain-containing protein n=1 Tax=Thermalbibacter longus TaxID=2951981 RepID=A0AA41WDQ8_9BACT|nr:CAP domain-containing protein [Thermalbibacter longus]MCM8747576.1 CAP domain-containing protein [Thermalbibacter longus]
MGAPLGARSRCTCRFLLAAVIAVLLSTPLMFASSPRAAASESTDPAEHALALINSYRAWLGLPPMTRHPALESAATAHARYYQLNYGDPTLAGMGLHQEQEGKPGFTGATIGDRARAHGYAGSVNENIGLSGSLTTSIRWFMGTVNHRLPLIDPRYTDIGFGWVSEGDVRIEVIVVGSPTWSDTASPEWVAWPADGTTGVDTHFWGEVPNPFANASFPIGYPITLKYFGAGDVEFTSASLLADGQPVDVLFATGSGWLSRRTALLAATKPLQPGTLYTYTITGTANGQPFTHQASFQTAVSPEEPLARDGLRAATQLPAGLAGAPPALQRVWWSTDAAVWLESEDRSWVWGPDIWATVEEPYAESPGGRRTVYYLDKARLEVTDQGGDPTSAWFVTSGLLVRDMILGAAQVGDNAFQPVGPAQVPLAGDPAPLNPDAPTYASLHHLAAIAPDRAVPDRTGQPVVEVLSRDGTVTTDPRLGSTTYAWYDPVTGINVAAVFWEWTQGQPWDWLYVLGHPISEPYWIRTRVAGAEQWVLVQAFERRLLTYTPSNSMGWQVEFGNVGRHYYEWRYGQRPPEG